MAKQYTHIFFDLDHTLWDFDANSFNAIQQMYHDFSLNLRGIPSPEKFVEVYKPINERMWALFHKNKISKDELSVKRFDDTLKVFNVFDFELSTKIAQTYIAISPFQKQLMPNTIAILTYLKNKYPLYIITNGFPEVQTTKMHQTGLAAFFEDIFISAEIGHQKPSTELFEIVLQRCNASPYTSIMIGDNMKTDIAGARESGLDQIYYNPLFKKRIDRVTYEINDLIELKNIL